MTVFYANLIEKAGLSMSPLEQNDKIVLEQHGLSMSQIEVQLQQLRQGMPPLHLIRPCRVGDGIVQLLPQQNVEYCKQLRVAQDAGRISKFIPASGAATRMFKDLLQFIETESASQTTRSIDSPLPEGIATAWDQLSQFPFSDDLQQDFNAAGIDIQNLYQTRQITRVFQALLHVPGLGYAHFPKAILPFHRYPEGTRTSLEEHVHEAMMYTPKATGLIRIHVTVSAQFEAQVIEHIDTIKQKLANSGFELELTVSIQKPSTDTVALDSHGEPFRDEQGRLIFRPGGHGALLENLNDYQGDIVCISNIDNVVPDYLKGEIVEWRMALAGYLLTLQDEIFHHLQQLELAHPTAVEKAQACIQQHLHQPFPSSYDQLDIPGKVDWLKRFLHRPIRVCGVVPNTGDPGGGPFWVQHADGSQSRQIVEQSQGDPESKSQQQLFALATHFNPVDMVCGVRDYRGRPFNLLTFSDPDTSFISHKTYQGRPLKALEWPGLWNGSMADWITIFVEVPRSTFNPVKTFLDWLHPNHQPPA
ncbi:MAG: DUF4301 family protein [Nitrospirales bacterium]